MLVSGDSDFVVSFSGVVLPPGSMRLAEEPLRPRMTALMLPTFRADRERVLEAVRQDGSALGWADAKLRADPGVVHEAVRKPCSSQLPSCAWTATSCWRPCDRTARP